MFVLPVNNTTPASLFVNRRAASIFDVPGAILVYFLLFDSVDFDRTLQWRRPGSSEGVISRCRVLTELFAVRKADLSQDGSEVKFVLKIKRPTQISRSAPAKAVSQVCGLRRVNNTEKEERRFVEGGQIPPDQGKTSQIPSFFTHS